nr:hypothetical protein [uncultured Desulfuromonas sp.]
MELFITKAMPISYILKNRRKNNWLENDDGLEEVWRTLHLQRLLERGSTNLGNWRLS